MDALAWQQQVLDSGAHPDCRRELKRVSYDRDQWSSKCNDLLQQKQAVDFFRKEANRFKETVQTLESNTGGLSAQKTEV